MKMIWKQKEVLFHQIQRRTAAASVETPTVGQDHCSMSQSFLDCSGTAMEILTPHQIFCLGAVHKLRYAIGVGGWSAKYNHRKFH